MKKKIHLKSFLKKEVIKKSQKTMLGYFSIKAGESGFLTKNQIEAARKVLTRTLKKINGRSWIKIKKFIPLTKKSKGARMGKGKGNFFCEVAPIKNGCILFELQGISDKTKLKSLLINLSSKLPIKIRVTGF